MHALYDEDGILRFINFDREACVAYADLFELSSSNFSLMDLSEPQKGITNLDQNQEENNN